MYGEWKQFERQIQERQVIFPDRRPGKHGYLVFESPAAEYNMEVVDGTRIGSLLTDTRVPVLVLNSCDTHGSMGMTTATTSRPQAGRTPRCGRSARWPRKCSTWACQA